MKMLNINDLKNKYETSALAHSCFVDVVVYRNDIFLIIFCYLVGIDSIAELCRLSRFKSQF